MHHDWQTEVYMCYSNSISYEALKLDGAHTDKETNDKNLFEYLF